MGKSLTWGYKVKLREVPKTWPISETGRASHRKCSLYSSRDVSPVREFCGQCSFDDSYNYLNRSFFQEFREFKNFQLTFMPNSRQIDS